MCVGGYVVVFFLQKPIPRLIEWMKPSFAYRHTRIPRIPQALILPFSVPTFSVSPFPLFFRALTEPHRAYNFKWTTSLAQPDPNRPSETNKSTHTRATKNKESHEKIKKQTTKVGLLFFFPFQAKHTPYPLSRWRRDSKKNTQSLLRQHPRWTLKLLCNRRIW